MDNCKKSYRLDGSLLAAPDKAASPSWGPERSSLVEGALAFAG